MKILISICLWIIFFVTFGLMLILSLVLVFILPAKIIDAWLKWGFHIILKLIHAPVRIEGREKIDRNRTYLFMANHSSMFDLLIMEAYIPVFARAVEAKEHFSWPIYGWAIRRLGNIPIDRKNPHSSIISMRKAIESLRIGRSMAVMPEGHRTLDGRLLPFKKLPFHLAKEAGVDIVPIGISGAFRLKPKNSRLIRPTPITMKFGDIIPHEKYAAMSVIELRDYVWKEIDKLIEKPQQQD